MSSPVASVPPVVAGYTWVRALGAGGFADVHLYRQGAPDRDVALKVLRAAGDARGTVALTAEANVLAGVAGHPSVVSLYGTGTTQDGRPYLAMEYCPVADLSDQVRRHPLAVGRALDLMVQIASAVETLHRRGFVHRDVKPANLMLTAWQRPVLGDFGATMAIGARSDSGGGFSMLWAAPEQQFGAPAHPRQDVWSLAATTWTLLAGHSPFEEVGGDNGTAAVAVRVQAGRLPALGRPDAPPELVAALRSALRPEVAARTGSASRFAEQLRDVQAAMHLPATPLVIRDSAVGSAPQAVDDNRTRVRGLVSVDAQPTGFEFSGPDPEPDAGVTLAPSAVSQSVQAPPPAPRRGGVRPWLVGVLVVVAAAVAGGVVAGVLGGGQVQAPQATASAPAPQDPVQAPPSAVTGLAGKLHDGRVYWTWHPADGDDLRYVFTITRPGHDDVTRDSTLTGVDITAVSGKNCIEVTVATADGRESAPADKCLMVP